tara:strand:+ start:7179 stop:9401 length:2223 start_codon:yes stop_codon:yes gene_type:complete
MKYLDSLSDIQRKCVEQTEGSIIIISGPGSGKTRVITSKIAHLINLGVNPNNILALTFTNKSAKEMVSRINNLIPEKPIWNLWAGTFHSVFAKILRKEANKIGFNNQFTILDNEDSKTMIKRIIQDHRLDKEIYKPSSIFSKISLLKNNLIDPKSYSEKYEMLKNDENKNQPKFSFIYKEYVKKCKQNDNMDFDDLLLNTLNLLRNDGKTLEKYQSIFKYILIDEFQDTNILQLEIIKMLEKKHNNLCVVGDDSQSIYSFRGANINNILNFTSFYTKSNIFKLEENFRSTKNILNAANSLISNNNQKLDKNIWTKKDQGEKIKITKTDSDKSEGNFIAKFIKDNSAIYNHSDYLVLYRMNSQSRSIEEGLRKLNINYKVFGLSFYNRREIKDILAYLKLIVNNQDEESLFRIINTPPRGIGKTTIEKIRYFANNNNVSIWELINSIEEIDLNINSGTKKRINNFCELINYFSENSSTSAFDLTSNLINKIDYFDYLAKEETVESISKIENVKELINAIKLFCDENKNDKIGEFLDQSVLVNENEQKKMDQEENFVSLMTIHQSKGLEFKNVFIIGLEENIFPSQQAMFSKKDIEEERRLLYVAITRAKEQVNLSYCNTRFRFNNFVSNEPSRFLNEIDESCISKSVFNLKIQSKINQSKNSNRYSFKFKTPKKLIKIKNLNKTENKLSHGLKIGKKIKHNIFGQGIITDLLDSNEKIVVRFGRDNIKTILVRYAKFDLID